MQCLYGLTGHLKNIHLHSCEHKNRKTKTNTNPNPDPNRYRRRCPDPKQVGKNLLQAEIATDGSTTVSSMSMQ